MRWIIGCLICSLGLSAGIVILSEALAEKYLKISAPSAEDLKTVQERRRTSEIQGLKNLLRCITDDDSLRRLKKYTDQAMRDLIRVEKLAAVVQQDGKMDKKTVNELAGIAAKYERLVKLAAGGDFCIFCVVNYADHRHFDLKTRVLINDEYRRKNDLEFLLKDGAGSERVLEYILLINAAPKDHYQLAINFFSEKFAKIKNYYDFSELEDDREETLEMIAAFIFDCQQAAADFQEKFRNLNSPG